MFQPSTSSAEALTPSAAAELTPVTPPPTPQYETVRHMIFGSFSAVHMTIKLLHKHRYAEPNDWSKPISTGRPNEVMVILTKKVQVG